MIQGFGLRSLRWSLPLLLVAAQVAWLVSFVARFAVRMPVSDHWIILGNLLTALERGDSMLPVLWSQHNEHRNFVGSLADLAMVKLGGGDVRLELYAMLLVAAIAGIGLGVSAWRWLRRSDPSLGAWIIPMLALLALSPAQMETWASAVQFPGVAQNLAVIGGLWVIGRAPLNGWKLGLAAGCGLVATACYIHGLLFWPAALVPLLSRSGRRWKPVALVWAVLSAAVWGAYFTNYVRPAVHPPLALQGSDLADLLLTFAGILGNPVGSFIRPQDPLAEIVIPLIGAAGLALLGFALVRFWRQPTRREDPWPWLGLAAYALLCAGAIAVGRHGFGFVAALSPRYITFVWPFWAATLPLLVMCFAPPVAASGGELPKNSKGRTLGRVVLGIVVTVELASINSQVQRWTPILRDRAAATRELPDICLGNGELVGRVGIPEEIASFWPVLTRYHVVRESPQLLEADRDEARPASGGAIESVRWEARPALPMSGRCVRIAGWAASDRLGPAQEVWLMRRGFAFKGAWVGKRRPHFGPDYDADSHPDTGWVIYVDSKRLDPQDRAFDLVAVFTAAPRPIWIGKVSL